MTDEGLVAKKLAFIETCVAQLRTMARPEQIATDVREERFVEHTLQLAIQAALDVPRSCAAPTPECATVELLGPGRALASMCDHPLPSTKAVEETLTQKHFESSSAVAPARMAKTFVFSLHGASLQAHISFLIFSRATTLSVSGEATEPSC
jgi:hypothetical protein